MGLLSDRELASLLPAETHAFAGPIPTQSVSSDEFMPAPQTARQRRVEGRLKELGGVLAKRHGMTRRRFRRQGGLEPGAARQGADHRRSKIRELLQGGLSRQRHQGRADLRRPVGDSARLVPHQ